MSDETTPVTDDGTDPAEKDWKALKDKHAQEIAARDAELSELRPLKYKETVRLAGFDPETGQGKSLIRDLAAGTVTVEEGKDLHTTLASYAEDEYGWKPTTTLTPAEQQQVTGTQRVQDLGSVTTSDEPASLEAQIAAADEAGNVTLGVVLRNRLQEQLAKA